MKFLENLWVHYQTHTRLVREPFRTVRSAFEINLKFIRLLCLLFLVNFDTLIFTFHVTVSFTARSRVLFLYRILFLSHLFTTQIDSHDFDSLAFFWLTFFLFKKLRRLNDPSFSTDSSDRFWTILSRTKSVHVNWWVIRIYDSTEYTPIWVFSVMTHLIMNNLTHTESSSYGSTQQF